MRREFHRRAHTLTLFVEEVVQAVVLVDLHGAATRAGDGFGEVGRADGEFLLLAGASAVQGGDAAGGVVVFACVVVGGGGEGGCLEVWEGGEEKGRWEEGGGAV